MPAMNCLLCGFISCQMCLLWKCSGFLLVEPSSVKSVGLITRDFRHIAEGTTDNFVGLSEKQADLELISPANSAVQQL